MSIFQRNASRLSLSGAALVSLATLATACNMGITEPASLDIAGGHLTAIGISGDSIVSVGDTIRLQASGSIDGLLGMFSYDPLDDAKWSTENATIATVTPRATQPGEQPYARAMISGVAQGTTFIKVSARGISARWPIHVVAKAP